MQFIAHEYQQFSVQKIIDTPHVGLFLEMGLGKTVSTLTAIAELIHDRFEVSKVLVVAPRRVAESTWTDELAKWDHLKHLKATKIIGSQAQRKAALLEKSDIYIIGRDNVAWLAGIYGLASPFDMVVLDELSSFKSHSSARFKAMKLIAGTASRTVGLTGTPAPNGVVDLWAQVYLLDKGARLGKNITAFRNKYLRQKYNGFGYEVRDDKVEGEIYDAIGDICVSMKAVDHLQMPECVDIYREIELKPNVQEAYEEFEREKVLEFVQTEEGKEITAMNAAALSNKLLQFAGGAVYDIDKNYHVVHDEKLDELEEILEAANGKPVLVFYAFRSDIERIQARFKAYKPTLLGQDSKVLNKWNEGAVQLLLAHPASAGHGLNMQAGGSNMVFFGLNWSLELYQQARARLYRQGQKNTVSVYHLVTKGTMDERVLKSLTGKGETQNSLLDAVKALVDKHKKSPL